jgi:hypothetical protein
VGVEAAAAGRRANGTAIRFWFVALAESLTVTAPVEPTPFGVVLYSSAHASFVVGLAATVNPVAEYVRSASPRSRSGATPGR